MHVKPLLALSLVGALSGCGDDPSGPEPVTPRFEISIEGALAETASGPAYFGADVNDDGDQIFAILLGEDASRHLVVAGKAGSARPAVGTYAIDSPGAPAPAWTLLHMLLDGDELLAIFVADAGSVIITESNADVLRGTLEFEATDLLGEEESTVRVTGSFVAIRATDISAARIGGLP